MKIEDLISPVTREELFTTILGKKPHVFLANEYRKEFFSNIITWKQFSDYVNNHRGSAGLQVITPQGNKLCMEKNNLHSDFKPFWDFENRYEVLKVFRNWQAGGSVILTKASMLTPNISAIAGCLEDNIHNSAADAHFYCSPCEDATSFSVHADGDDNFLVHAIGKVHWQVFTKQSRTECVIDTVLGPGDLLYIPKGTYHKAEPVTARISISVPVAIIRGIHPLSRDYCDFEKFNS